MSRHVCLGCCSHHVSDCAVLVAVSRGSDSQGWFSAVRHSRRMNGMQQCMLMAAGCFVWPPMSLLVVRPPYYLTHLMIRLYDPSVCASICASSTGHNSKAVMC